jgi:hypothetical protein
MTDSISITITYDHHLVFRWMMSGLRYLLASIASTFRCEMRSFDCTTTFCMYSFTFEDLGFFFSFASQLKLLPTTALP